ncbi:unnamed protein product [marine sediment metagenome]|uniref:Uncharacterized protein n=1 Tax=marine sediment metagenome TaxID=412755 RepID=X0U988_9ZZZZ
MLPDKKLYKLIQLIEYDINTIQSSKIKQAYINLSQALKTALNKFNNDIKY